MILTQTGKLLDYQNITKDGIDIEDISTVLPRINRFLGHTVRTYSVAEHTIRGLALAEILKLTPIQKLHWLMHDFTEAYVGDCPSPLKKLLPQFSVIENQIAEVIREYAGIPAMNAEEQELVHRIDHTMLLIEMRDLTDHDYREEMNELAYSHFIDDPRLYVPTDPREVAEVDVSEAKLAFLLRWHYRGILKEVRKEHGTS